jgi:hypothetical protein
MAPSLEIRYAAPNAEVVLSSWCDVSRPSKCGQAETQPADYEAG